jgi:hypothetical protein
MAFKRQTRRLTTLRLQEHDLKELRGSRWGGKPSSRSMLESLAINGLLHSDRWEAITRLFCLSLTKPDSAGNREQITVN